MAKKKQHPNSLKNLKPFEKGKSGNPKGRPKSIMTQMKELLKQDQDVKGTLDISGYKDISLWLMERTQDQLKKIITNKTTPAFIVVLARAIQKDMAKGSMWSFDNIFDKFVKDSNENDGTDIIFNVGFDLGANSVEDLQDDQEEETE